MMRHVTVLFLLVGCDGATDLAGTAPTSRIVEGSPEAIGLLALVNDGATTFELLDDGVGLDRRAASSIVHHRDGGDATFGTADDQPFEAVAEVDALYYVGESALQLLADFAWDQGLVPAEDEDVLGTWDGVTFTVAEADRVVELANTAGGSYLDDDLALDARAVDSIVGARPIATVQELAGLYYVGQTALTTLKEAAAGVPGCETPGWDITYVYADDSDQWRKEVPAELAALVDSLLAQDDWCGEAYGEPWFVKATIDRFDCVDAGYTVELGQLVDAHHGLEWTIGFEVDAQLDTDGAVCEI